MLTREREGQGRRAFSRFLLLAFVSLLLLVFDEVGLLNPVKGQAIGLLSPLQGGLYQLRSGAAEVWDDLGGADQLRAHNADLERQISQLTTENLRLQTIKAENQHLRQSLELRQSFDWETMGAGVISPDADSDRQAVLIDRGAVDGIAVGMVVVGQDGPSPVAMLGTVEEVYPHSARVLLITDYRSVISARVIHHQSTPQGVDTVHTPSGEVQGRWQLGSWLVMEKLEREAILSEGDLVVTAGLSQQLGVTTPLARVPDNVPIGSLQAIRARGHTQEAEVRPFLDPDRVRNVWVILGSD